MTWGTKSKEKKIVKGRKWLCGREAKSQVGIISSEEANAETMVTIQSMYMFELS